MTIIEIMLQWTESKHVHCTVGLIQRFPTFFGAFPPFRRMEALITPSSPALNNSTLLKIARSECGHCIQSLIMNKIHAPDIPHSTVAFYWLL